MGVEEIVEITRISWWVIGGIFSVYILTHFGFIVWYKSLSNKKNKSIEEQKQYRTLKFISKWWHAIYLIIVVIYFMIR